MTINYIQLMNWFWQEMPYKPGYKSEYGIVFLALVDLCNRNDWRETSAEYDRLINKTRVSKRLYYEAIKWLTARKIIGYQRGFNDYAPAKFSIKVEVQKGDTTITTDESQQDLNSDSTDTTTPTTTAPILNKPINQETSKQLDSAVTPQSVDTSVKKNGRGQMVKPDLPTLTAYVIKRGGNKKMAEAMFNYYGSKGWKVGKDPMTNWNLAASGWISRHDDEGVIPLNGQAKQMVV